jgi:TorA maturation chaperone TorD
MTKEEKDTFCQLMASLLSPPDQEMVEQIHQGNLSSFFEHYRDSWGMDIGLLKGFLMEGNPQILLTQLKKEYNRLFSDVGGKNVSLVESVYKPWSQDPSCCLPFATDQGLLMGDSALHLLAVYQQCGLEVSEEFRGRSDHIVLELEFLSSLYRWASDREISRFIEDHLDWIPLLKEEVKKFNPHPFYSSVLEILDLFLHRERKRLEMESDGKKNTH